MIKGKRSTVKMNMLAALIWFTR